MGLALDYYTVGGGEYVDFALRAIDMLLGDSAFSTLVRVTFLWGAVWAITLAISGWQYRTFFIRHMAYTFFALHLFFMPVVDLTITDTKTGQVYTHQNTPFVPGFAMSFFSNLSRYLTKFFENVGHTGTIVVWGTSKGAVPAQIDYSKTDIAGMFDYFDALMKVDPSRAAKFSETLEQMQVYLARCFIPYSATLSDAQVKNILKSTDLINAIQVNASLLMEYRGNTYTCTDFYNNVLLPNWNTFVTEASNNPELLEIPAYKVPIITGAINALTNASHSFSSIVSQAGIINATRYVLSTYTFGDQSINILAEYAKGRADEQAKAVGKAFGVWVKENLPLLKNFLQAFVIFLLPLTGLILLLPFPGPKLIIGYLYFTAWVYLWDPILAILDIFIKMSAIAQAHAWLDSQGASGLSLITYGYIIDQAQWFPAIAGYIGLSAPMWAWAVLKGFEVSVYGVSHLIGSMGSSTVAQEMNVQNLSRLTQEERLAREAGFTNAGEAGWYASGYAGAQEVAQGWWRRSLSDDLLLAGATGGMAHSIGRGAAIFNAHGGSAVDMLNSAALTAPSIAYRDPATGQLVYHRTDVSGRPVSVHYAGAAEYQWSVGNVMNELYSKRQEAQETYQENLQRYQSQTYSLAAQAAKGKGLAKMFSTSDAYQDLMSKSETEEVRTMAQHHERLSKELQETFGLQKQEAEKLATQLMFSLGIQKEAGGGGKGFRGKLLSLLKGAGAGGDVRAYGSLVDEFMKSKAFQEAKQFAQSDDFSQALSSMVQYAHNKLSQKAKQMGESFNETEDAKLLESLNAAVQYARNAQAAKSAAESYQAQLSFISSVKEDWTHWFTKWFADRMGIDIVAAGQALNSLYYSDREAFQGLVREFLKDVGEGGGREQIKRVVDAHMRVKEASTRDLTKEVDQKVQESIEEVKKFYEASKAEVEGKGARVKNEVLKGMVQGQAVRKEVNDQQANIKNAINARAEWIRGEGQKVGPDDDLKAWLGRLNEARENPLNLGKHMLQYGPGHKYIMGGTAAFAAASSATEAVSLAKDIYKAVRGAAGKVFTTIESSVPYGRFGWIEGLVTGYRAILTAPAFSAAGAAGTIALAPLVAIGAYEGTRYVMENVHVGGKSLDDYLYEKVTEPLLDRIFGGGER